MTRLRKKYIVFIEPNIVNPLMWLFSFISKPDKKSRDLRVKKICSLLEKNNFKKTKIFRTGFIFQNATPKILVPILKLFDRSFFFGAYIIFIFQKR